MESARKALIDTPRSCAANFMLSALPDSTANLELGSDSHLELSAEDGVLVHANHFVDQAAAGVEEPPNPRRHHSEHRHARLDSILRSAAPMTRYSLMELLRDHDGHPNSVCRHPDEEVPVDQRVLTVCAVIMEPGSGRMWITEGPPCEAEFEEYQL
jgi:isopenicillin-N N-acyltransferase-like protein